MATLSSFFSQLHWIDWAVLALYFAFSLGVGLWFVRRAGSSTAEFFVSGRDLPWWLAGTSMVATSFSVDTPHDLGLRYLDDQHLLERLAALGQEPVQALRLVDGPREAVEDGSAGAFRAIQDLVDQPEDHVVGHQLARLHGLLGLLPELGPGGQRLPQQVAGRDLTHPALLSDPARLGSLAGPRRSHEDQIAAPAHRRPRIFLPFVMNPS